MMSKTRSIDMTAGSLWKNIFFFSIPLMFSQILEVLFNLSDVAIAGKFAGYQALGSVGSTTLLVSLFTGFLLGMGAAIGTLTARILELAVVLCYVLFREKTVRLFSRNPFRRSKVLAQDYRRVAVPVVLTNLLWSLATPIQTGILGHLSSDAIAANSVSTTMFQYLKVVTVSQASATSVSIGKMVGEGHGSRAYLRPYVRALQALFLVMGLILGGILLAIRQPLLGLYALSPSAMALADRLLILMVIIFIGMAYQMPVSVGIIRGGGETKFNMYMNLISTWGIVMPLSFAAAFWWKLPVFWVVLCLNSDQLFKCIPVAIYANSYRWIHVLTRKSDLNDT